MQRSINNLVIGYNLYIPVLVNANARIGCPQINPNDRVIVRQSSFER